MLKLLLEIKIPDPDIEKEKKDIIDKIISHELLLKESVMSLNISTK
jgi:hypothetical protein